MSWFEQAEAIYKKILGPAIERQRSDYFTSSEYTSLRSSAGRVFDRIGPGAEEFLSVVRGTNTGAEIGRPGIEDALSIPKRVLDKPASTALPPDLAKTLDKLNC